MTAIIIFFDITNSPMPSHAAAFTPPWPIGSFTIWRTAAWHDRQSPRLIAAGQMGPKTYYPAEFVSPSATDLKHADQTKTRYRYRQN
jgi:hypothetical protein